MNLSENKIPKSIGIIMDGNRRYARSKGLPVFLGHNAGYKTLKNVVRWAKERGVQYLVVYAFSTENWQRQENEVSHLMELANFVFGDSREAIRHENVRVKCVGDLSRLSATLQKNMSETEQITAGYEGITLVVCISYGGRQEILRAVEKMCEEKKLNPAMKFSEEKFSSHLGTAGIPDPDLIIRTGGEMRLSNFLPWQCVYSELFFTKTFWPDFSEEEFKHILKEYAERDRRKGK